MWDTMAEVDDWRWEVVDHRLCMSTGAEYDVLVAKVP